MIKSKKIIKFKYNLKNNIVNYFNLKILFKKNYKQM